MVTDPLFEAWGDLKRHLESRSRVLTEEVRHYPTPIARCDEQLTKLLEQREHAVRQLRRMLEHERQPSRPFLRQFIDSCTPSDDEDEMTLVSRLRAALQRPGRKRTQ